LAKPLADTGVKCQSAKGHKPATSIAPIVGKDGNGNSFASNLARLWSFMKIAGCPDDLYNVVQLNDKTTQTELNKNAVRYLQSLFDAQHDGSISQGNKDLLKSLCEAMPSTKQLHSELRMIGVECEAMRQEVSTERLAAMKRLDDIALYFPGQWVVRIDAPKLPQQSKVIEVILGTLESESREISAKELLAHFSKLELQKLKAVGAKLETFDRMERHFQVVLDGLEEIKAFREGQLDKLRQAEIESKAQAIRENEKRKLAELEAVRKAELADMEARLDEERQARIKAQNDTASLLARLEALEAAQAKPAKPASKPAKAKGNGASQPTA
jgi:hypothetical protein